MSWRASLVAVAITVPLLALLWFGLQRDPRMVPSPLPGRAAPEFALAVMPASDDGAIADSIALARLRGEIVVLNFWASWCVPCRYEHPVLIEAVERYRDRPVRFLGVLYKDTEQNARAFLGELGDPGYPTLLDPRSRVGIDYGITGVPETFVIGPDGTIENKIFGPVSYTNLFPLLDDLLAGAAPRTAAAEEAP